MSPPRSPAGGSEGALRSSHTEFPFLGTQHPAQVSDARPENTPVGASLKCVVKVTRYSLSCVRRVGCQRS